MNFDSLRFGSGRSGDQDELAAFVQGKGSYTSDIDIPGQLHACFVRSTESHGIIKSIDVAQARALPGVHAVITGRDLQDAGIGVIAPMAVFKGRDGAPMASAGIPPLAYDVVRHVGEAVALVLADTPAIAQDGADLVRIELDPLPLASTLAHALRPDAPRIWPNLPDNVALDWEDGDAKASAAIFDNAFYVQSVELDDPPMAACPLEPRAAIAHWDAALERCTLIACTQGVMVARKLLAEGVFKMDLDKLRVVTPDVGGGFGAKVQTYPEYAAVMYAAKVVRRPVKWTATRLESFLADTHARHSKLRGKMAFDRDGRILGLSVDAHIGIGAYTTTYVAIIATNNMKNCLSSVYRIPSIHMRSRLVFTNTSPLGPYRGAGRPEAIYTVERLLDRAAEKFGIGRDEMRRRNLVPASAMPYSAPNGQVYDSGEFEAILDQALALSDWKGFEARRAEAAKRGILRGIGICCFLEVAGGILDEPARLQFAEDGTVSLHIGAQAIGQGHLATYPRLVAGRLGIDAGKVRLVCGDSDQTPGITATVASRSTMMCGSATAMSCDEAIRRGTAVASHLLEAPASDIKFSDGAFRIEGTDRSVPILEMTALLSKQKNLPEGVSAELSNIAKFVSPAMSFPNGCHICEVEIDPETGVIRVLQHTAVDDVGVILDNDIVEGQVIGGVAQGLGQVLGERLIYAEDGQLVNASFMDYPMPHADDMPRIVLGHQVVPCRTNPLGVKGAGESGVAGSMPSAISAILDALSVRGVKAMDLPFTSERVRAALNQVRAAA